MDWYTGKELVIQPDEMSIDVTSIKIYTSGEGGIRTRGEV
jgi:hypothetical protein